MKKIKIIEYTDRWTTGGIEKYIVSLVSNLDNNLFQPLVLTAQKETGLYDAALAKNKIKVQSLLSGIYEEPIKRIKNTWKLFYDFIYKMKPDIIHLHICQGVGFVYAYLAKKAGVKVVITHSHNSDCGYTHRLVKLVGHKICRLFLQRNADVKLACSDLAGKWLYGTGKKFKIVNIPVDIEHFKFNETKRIQIRQQLQLNDEFVILNIGRMGEQKNQLYLIDLFQAFQKKYNAKLFIIGNGEYEQIIKKKIKEYLLEDKVILIEKTSEVEKFLWMADVFVLTSLYEGNPIVLIEAQASGLGCVYSDTITNMAKINKNVTCVPLNAEKQVWINKIIDVSNVNIKRIQGYQNVKKHGYNVNQIMQEMQEIYLRVMHISRK